MSETKCSYDVFLSFRGEDTRYTFTGNLYEALCRKGIITFMDDEELRIGEQIAPALLKAIEESRISIIIFSKNYASSRWCLDELVKILECKKERNLLIWPIFYKVEPSDVRHQRKSYGEAMTEHETRFGNDSEKVRKWRSALSEVSNFKGYHLKEGYEFRFIQEIVSKAFVEVSPKDLVINELIVGWEYRVAKLKSLLEIKSHDTTCTLGIYGTGGIGKTTLAKALYNSIYKQFEGGCFLSDVRETSSQFEGEKRLQQILLSDMLEEGSIHLQTVNEGTIKIKRRLGKKRVLIVFDDVDNIKQLENLARQHDWFGSGSRIIITTRDKHVLDAYHVENRYEVKVLNDHDSLKVFCWNAFKMEHPKTNYEDLSNRAIRYAKGLPLALKVIGSNLIGRDLDEWKSALDKYEKNPHKDIQSILRISYDSLDCEQKNIFLDIACFFKGWNLEDVESILNACDFNPKYDIQVLGDKCLISIKDRELRMHDLIQDMGKEVVRQEPISKKLGKRSRLWFHEDVIKVLIGNSGSSNIEGIMLDPPQQEEIEWSGTAFEKMDNLRILIIKNACFSRGPVHLPNSLRLLDWEKYPSESFPPDFNPSKIVIFNLRCSRLRLVEPFKKYEYLTSIDFSFCEVLTQIPDMSKVPNIRELKLQNCGNLTEVHKSVGYLNKLVCLDVSHCINLISFPREIKLTSLQSLYLEGCVRLDHFPRILGKMDALTCIRANDTSIEELPHSIGNLTGLSQLEMRSDVKHMRELPSSLFMLQNLHWLVFKPSPPYIRKSIRKCLRQLSFQFYRKFPKESLKQVKSMEESYSSVICGPKLDNLTLPNCGLLDADLHLILNCFQNLRMLFLSGNDFVSLPPCIAQLHNLRLLDVSHCKKLQDIPEIPSNWKKIKVQNCASLTTESSRRLWSQVLKEGRELEITMPQTTIPDWFNHGCMGGTLSFSIKGKFPLVALAFFVSKAPPPMGEEVNVMSASSSIPTSPIIEGLDTEGHRKLFLAAKNLMSQLQHQRDFISRIKGVKNEKARGLYESTIEVRLFVNGRPVINSMHLTSQIIHRSSDPIIEGNALVWTPRASLEEEGWQELDALLAYNVWNDVVIQAKCSDSSSNLAVNYCAIYVYQTDGIQFECFDPSNNSSMVSRIWEPIKLKGSQEEQTRLLVEGMFGTV